jgi:hypothetical protein
MTRNNYEEMAKEKNVGTLDGLVTINEVDIPDDLYDQEGDPIILFYEHIARELGLDLKEIDVNLVAVGKDTAERWNTALIKEMRKKTRTTRFEYAYGMEHLCYSPRCVSDVEEGKAYILKREED